VFQVHVSLFSVVSASVSEMTY